MLKDGYFCLRAVNGSLPMPTPPSRRSIVPRAVAGFPPRVAYFQAKMDVEAKAVKSPRPEAPLGILHARRQPELPLEVHDGPADDPGLHRGPRTCPP